MLFWLTQFSDGGDFFNLFRYITFRAGGAVATALFIGLGAMLGGATLGGRVRDDGVSSTIDRPPATANRLAASAPRHSPGPGSADPRDARS